MRSQRVTRREVQIVDSIDLSTTMGPLGERAAGRRGGVHAA
jgi:hypothetical protein